MGRWATAAQWDDWCEVIFTDRHILSDPQRRIPLETLVLTPQEVLDRLTNGDQFLELIIEEGEVLYAA